MKEEEEEVVKENVRYTFSPPRERSKWAVFVGGRGLCTHLAGMWRFPSIIASLSGVFPPLAHSVLVKVSDLVFSFARILATLSQKKINAKRRPSSSSSSSSRLRECERPLKKLTVSEQMGIQRRVGKEVRGVAYFPESDQSRGFGVGAEVLLCFFFCISSPLILSLYPLLMSPAPDGSGWREIRLLVPLSSHMISANICQV